MLTLFDIVEDEIIPEDRREALTEFAEENNVGFWVPILTPTDSNNDVSGSQLHGDDFSYRDADIDDILNGETLGFYEYFSRTSKYGYTGHYYNGDGNHFSAVVVDPPAYAVERTF